MQTVQRVLLLAFAVLAALTVFQQMRYGMMRGRAEGEDKQDDPKAKACRQRAVLCAVGRQSVSGSILRSEPWDSNGYPG